MKIHSADDQSSKSSTSDVIVPAVLTRSKSWMKPTDQMDSWLDTQGFYRKHIARDASSLFRCVSEVVFLTQVHHLNVRRHCIQFAMYQSDTFTKLTNVPIKDYVERLSNPREWGTRLDMEVMSLIYGLDFAMYKEVKQPLEKVTNNGFKFSIILSMSYEHHYDSVYPKQHIMDAAVCQSILYEMLYKQVFKLEEVDYAVNKMLHDKSTHYQTDLNPNFFSSGFQLRLEMRDNCRNVKDLLNYGITPFPYKVAKSLDPNIYRNVEYDTWNEQRKGLRHLLNVWNDRELQVGSRCVINFGDRSQITKRHGYIQQMSPNKGPVVVYVEELGEKLTVPFESLELIPAPPMDTEGKTESEHELSEIMTRSFIMKGDKFSNKSTDNVPDSNMKKKVFSMEAKNYYSAGSVPELCNVHYVHPTTTVVPSTCYSCVTSQTSQSEANDVKSMQITSHSTGVYERSKRHLEFATVEQSPPIPMQYTVPMYPIISPDMSVPPTVMPTSYIPPKTLNSNEYIDNNSSVRVMYNSRSSDSYYRYGYSPQPYYVVPSNVIYPPPPPEHAIQQNVDSTRIHCSSYPLPQVPNEMMYTLPMPGSTTKTELSSYPLVHPAASYSVKNTIPMNGCSPAGPMPSTYPVVSSAVCPITYPTYTSPPMYYQPFDYCISCPDFQGCENVTQSYATHSYMPVAYTEEGYPPNTPIYCQPMLPVSHS